MIESQSLSLHKMQTEPDMYSNSCLNELSSNDDQNQTGTSSDWYSQFKTLLNLKWMNPNSTCLFSWITFK